MPRMVVAVQTAWDAFFKKYLSLKTVLPLTTIFRSIFLVS